MKKFKSVLAILLTVVLSAVLVSCSSSGSDSKASSEASTKDEGKKIKVVATIFPPYDFVRQIAGDNVELQMLLPPASESHSFEPTPKDIVAVDNCDIFIYAGGESDEWVNDILKSTKNENRKVISMMDCVDVVEEEIVEGMEKEEEEESDEKEYDEHVWTSPVNAIKIVNKITEALSEADESNKEVYTKNSEEYINKLKDIDAKFKDLVANAKRKTIVLGDRFPLRYFTDEYNLKYYAAFPGCSSSTEPSAATVAFLIDKVKKEKIPAVFNIELSNEKVSETICKETGAKRLTINACHNVSKEDFDKGITYIDLMNENLKVLKEALN